MGISRLGGGGEEGEEGAGRDGALEFGQKAVLPAGSLADAGWELAVWSRPSAHTAGSLRGRWRESTGFVVPWSRRAGPGGKLRYARRTRTGGGRSAWGPVRTSEGAWSVKSLKDLQLHVQDRTTWKRCLEGTRLQRRPLKSAGECVRVCRVLRPLGGDLQHHREADPPHCASPPLFLPFEGLRLSGQFGVLHPEAKLDSGA